MKKLIILLLIIALTLCAVACDSTPAESSAAVSSAESAQESTDESEPKQRYTAELPENFTYDGATVTILTDAPAPETLTRFEFGYNPGELAASVVNEAALERNRYVEELLDCTIVERCLDSTKNEMAFVLPSEIRSGKSDYAFVSMAVREANSLLSGGWFYNLLSLENLHGLEAEWWDTNFNEPAAINGTLFFAAGDIGFRSRDSLACLYFNKQMAETLDLESPYELVRQKKWTIDLVTQWSKTISHDTNSDGKIDYHDEFGMGGQNDNMWAMFYGGGGRTIVETPDGEYEVALRETRTVDVAEAIMELMSNKDTFVNANDLFGESGWVASPCEFVINAFVDNRCLIYSSGLGDVEVTRNMAVDFGILPMPLYDENQEDYYTFMNPWACTVFMIPTSLSEDEAERSAALMELFGAEGKNTLIPAYYEVCLKGQRTRDDESIEMLDIIIRTAGCDVGHIYDWGSIGLGLLHPAITAPKGTYISLCDSKQLSIENAIKAALPMFDD